MKKSVVILLAAISLFGLNASADEPAKGAAIEFAETTYDFGNVSETDGSVQCTFPFRNTGTTPLVIIDASAGCGCTTPSYPKKPIAPGKENKITVTFNPLGRPGEFEKYINLRTNAKGKGRKIRLTITGVVVPPAK